MAKDRKRNPGTTLSIAALICIAYACRVPGLLGFSMNPLHWWVSFTRSLIYFLLIAGWGISVHRRIIQIQVRRYLTVIVCLMLFWILVRTVKFDFTASLLCAPLLSHWLWYLYYLPIIFIPMFTLFVSRVICQSEDYRIPRKVKLLYIPAAILLALVLTNDFHNMVFLLPPDNPLTSESAVYRYGFGYYAVIIWWVFCFLCSVASLFAKNRLPNKSNRILIPVGFLMLLGLYVILYWINPPWMSLVSDFSAVFCLILMAFFESLFRLGLIQSNTHYVDLFRSTGIPAVIVNDAYQEVISTAAYQPLSAETMRQAEDAPVVIPSGVRLSSAPIPDGRIIWTEDISELAVTMDKLAQIEAFLSARRDVAEKELESSRQKHRVIERKNLYDSIVLQTGEEIRQYDNLISGLKTETDPDRIRRIVLRITVICAYIKRKISLIFLAMDNGEISREQFDACVCKDMLPCICGCGATGDYSSNFCGSMPIQTALTFYSAFYTASMAALDTLEAIDVRLSERKGVPILVLRLTCSSDLSALSCRHISPSHDGRDWTLTVTPEGEDAL